MGIIRAVEHAQYGIQSNVRSK